MTTYNDTLSQYINNLFVKQDQALKETLEDIPRQGLPTINVKPEEGKFLQFLVRANGATKAVEIGTLGGYSGTWIARGLAPGGKLITLEKEPRHAQIAQKHFQSAGLDGKVDIRIGDAHQTLKKLSGESPFDFIFIDAEKDGYQDYFNWAIENVRLGGVIAAHNAFRKGTVAGIGEDDDWTEIMREFNRRVAEDDRIISTIYPAGDGMIVAVKVK